MRRQSLQVLLPLVGQCGVAIGGSGQRAVKVIFGFLEV